MCVGLQSNELSSSSAECQRGRLLRAKGRGPAAQLGSHPVLDNFSRRKRSQFLPPVSLLLFLSRETAEELLLKDTPEGFLCNSGL